MPKTQHFWVFGTWTRGARDLDSRRHGTLTQIYGAEVPCAASRGPLRREVPCGAASRGPWGQNENPKMLSFGRL